MRNKRFSSTASVFVIALAAILMGPAPATAADELILSGAVSSSAGEAMSGVMVSAKARGATVTTSVLTDGTGNYYFPPLPAGQYRVWAQALSFDTAKGEVDLGTTRRQNFVLQPLEEFVRQLPGNILLSGLPAESEQDKRMKRLVRNICTGCHTASYVLQHRFDEAGWSAIIELMKNANVYGTYMGATRKPSGILDFHQKELAAYLARARGPGDNGLKIKLEPRPTGEAARVVFREYDVPLDPDAGLPSNFVQNDGSDWSLGTPSVLIPGWGVHDAWLDLDQNVWFTCNIPNKQVTIGKITSKTGAVKLFKVPAANGLAAQTHGMTRDPSGIIWFNVNPGRGGIGRLDPKTEKIDVFIPPEGMSPTGGATTVDYDGKGKIWSSSPDGALRFDPETGKFTEFKSITYKTPNGTGVTYGMAADRDGNGWWAEMTLDIIGKGNVATGKSEEVQARSSAGGAGPRHAGSAQVLRDLQPARLQQSAAVGARPAPDGHRQGRRRAVGRQLVGRKPRPHRHQDQRDDLRAAAGRAAALSRARRQDPWRLDQPVGRRPGDALRPEVGDLDGVRPADPRRRAALCVGRSARRRADAGGAAVFPGAQGRDHDLAQRGRAGGAQEPGRATVSVLLARQATGRKGFGQQAASARDGISWAGRSIRAVIRLAATSLGGSDGTAPLMARLDPSEHSTA